MATKKAAGKKSSKKTAAKKPAKKVTKKSVKKSSKKAVAVKPVTDSTGVVTMKSVDDPGTATQDKGVSVQPKLDKETGVLTMVPDSD